MIEITYSGNFNNIEKFLKNATKIDFIRILETYGKEGVDALKAATPKQTGLTADSWYYKIKKNPNSLMISWNNSNIQNGVPIAVIIQYGHGTKNGGYVEGRDYINPALQPIFDKIANSAWKEVSRL